jgi:hypothetical protein
VERAVGLEPAPPPDLAVAGEPDAALGLTGVPGVAEPLR